MSGWRLLVAAFLLANGAALAREPAVTLASDRGPVDLDALPGQLQFLAVGYTRCTDGCPETLGQMKSILRLLGPHAQRVTAVFVSVDYARDTPAAVSAYVQQVSPEILGLAGDSRQIGLLIERYPVDMKITGQPGETAFTIDHSTGYLVLRHGDVVGTLPAGLSPEVMADLIIDYLGSIGIGNR